MTGAERARLFPLAYAAWYAASLFMEAGHPATAVLQRIGLDKTDWDACKARYGLLHFADTGWVTAAYAREGLPPPEGDRGLHAHLVPGAGLDPPPVEPFSLRRQLALLRRSVEADPRIGCFADVDWVAQYLGERRFPTIRYVHDGRHVHVDGVPIHDRHGAPITGVDPHSFRPLADRWFRDATRVYGQGETPSMRYWFVVRGADPDSFTVLNERYAADKAAGYYITNLRLPTEQPGSFEIVGYPYGHGQKPGFHVMESHYARDSRHVYAYGVAIPGAHAPSFAAIGDEGKYFADRDRVYWERTPIEGADRASFTCASQAGQYRAFDAHRPYYAGLPQSVSAEFDRWSAYFAARPEITDSWWHREKLRRAAAVAGTAAPRPIGGPYFSDGRRILVRPLRPEDGDWVSLDHLDHESFRHIADVFGRDRHGLRYIEPGLETHGLEAVKGADPDSFVACGDGWFKDRHRAYHLDSTAVSPRLVIVKADMPSFTVIGGAYARDATGLIVAGVRRKGIADPASVMALGFQFARLGDTLLYRGKPVARPGALDLASLRGLHDRLAIDRHGHMLVAGRHHKPIPGLDPATLRFLNQAFAADRDAVYALTTTGLLPCPMIDRRQVRPRGPFAVEDDATFLRIAADRLEATPRASAEGR